MWELVRQKARCQGSEEGHGKVASINACASMCNQITSMFIFGTNDFGKDECDGGNCDCFCESDAADDGTCQQIADKGFRLYRFKKFGT